MKKITNVYDETVFGIGCLGEYEFLQEEKGITVSKLRSYKIWKHMLERAYDPKYVAKYPTYDRVEVSNEWKNYAIFKKWYDSNYIENFVLDKDLKQLNVKNKVYSEETCVFIPSYLNSFLASYTKNPNNTSGITGVSLNQGRWMVTIYDYELKRNINLGRYDDIEQAKIVYQKAKA